MPPQNTSVGSRPTQRKVPMQVLALGYSRAGTLSLKIALETLGYVRTNHGFAVAFASPATMDMWIEAIKAKFHGEGTPYGRAEWDRLLGDCQAVSDVPHILFVEELIAAYPDVKVILTNRNAESWWKSYETTVAQARKPSFQVRLVSWLDPEHDGKREYLFQLIFKAIFNTEQLTVTEEKAKACFTAHYDEVRRLTSKDRLLEFEVKEGWAPLAAFLGREAPATAFPRVNDTAQFHKSVSARRRGVLWKQSTKVVGPFLIVAAAAMLVYVGSLGRA